MVFPNIAEAQERLSGVFRTIDPFDPMEKADEPPLSPGASKRYYIRHIRDGSETGNIVSSAVLSRVIASDPELETQQDAIEALVALHPKLAAVISLALTYDWHTDNQHLGLTGLAESDFPFFLERAGEFIEDPGVDGGVRSHALEILADTSLLSTQILAERLLSDKDQEVVETAEAILTRTEQVADHGMNLTQSFLADLGEEVALMTACLTAPEKEVRLQSMERALNSSDFDNEVLSIKIFSATGDRNRAVRSRAIEALKEHDVFPVRLRELAGKMLLGVTGQNGKFLL